MPDPHARHSRNKWEWGPTPPRSQERQKAADTDPEPPPKGRSSYKNTRKWCRGKAGVEHEEEIILGRDTYRRKTECGWSPLWSVERQDYTVSWYCNHHVVCKNCSKVLDDKIFRTECPAYPGTTEQHASAQQKLTEMRARRAERIAKSSVYRKPVITGPQHYRRPRS